MPLTALRRLLLSALLAGLAAGIVSSTLQQLFLVPLILRAEALETAAQSGGATGVGLERAAYSLVFTCVGACAFALLLTGCWSLRGEVDWRRGLLWGLAGFAVFSLAPALGLPPELPGAHAADLAARQAWWVGTAIATAAVQNLLGGDAAMARARKPDLYADAAYAVITRPSRDCSGNAFLCEDVLAEEGVTDFDRYAYLPGAEPQVDLYVDHP